MFRLLLVIAFALPLAIAVPRAQSQPIGFPRHDAVIITERFTDLDRAFLEYASQLHEMELQIATLATSRARDVRVRQLVPGFIRDHEIELNQLKRIAAKRNVTLPPLSEIQQETLERLSGLEGHPFDRAFLQQILNEHNDQFGIYRDISENPNLDLRAYGEPRIQSIREHLQRAQYVALTPIFGRWAISNPK